MTPFDDPWFAFGIPGGLLLFAGGMYLWLRYQARAFDRKYGPKV